ncbi:MAG: hypothetical protein AAGF11_34100 [Myxococcota bacterium]
MPQTTALRHALVTALLLTCACGEPKSTKPAPASVRLDDAQQKTLARFLGAWEHAGGAAEQEAAKDAVRTVTAQMSGFIRGMAQSRLDKTVHLDPRIEITEQDGVVTITRSDRPRPFVAPADGKTFSMPTDEDDDGQGSLRIDGDTLVARLETDGGGGERVYRVDAEGMLRISGRVFSSQLPTDVVYTASYARP